MSKSCFSYTRDVLSEPCSSGILTAEIFDTKAGEKLIAAGVKSTIIIFNYESGKQVHSISLKKTSTTEYSYGKSVYTLLFFHGCEKRYLISEYHNELFFLDVENGYKKIAGECDRKCSNVYSRNIVQLNDRLIAFISKYPFKNVVIYDVIAKTVKSEVEAGKVSYKTKRGYYNRSSRFDGKFLSLYKFDLNENILFIGGERRIVLYNWKKDEAIRSIKTNGTIYGLNLLFGKNFLCASDETGTISIYENYLGSEGFAKLVKKFKPHYNIVPSVLTYKSWMISCSFQQNIKFYQFEGDRVSKLSRHEERKGAVELKWVDKKRKEYFISVGDDGRIVEWKNLLLEVDKDEIERIEYLQSSFDDDFGIDICTKISLGFKSEGNSVYIYKSLV